jgi:hypothetical protein
MAPSFDHFVSTDDPAADKGKELAPFSFDDLVGNGEQ